MVIAMNILITIRKCQQSSRIQRHSRYCSSADLHDAAGKYFRVSCPAILHDDQMSAGRNMSSVQYAAPGDYTILAGTSSADLPVSAVIRAVS